MKNAGSQYQLVINSMLSLLNYNHEQMVVIKKFYYKEEYKNDA